MSLRLYNTATRKKEEFQALRERTVGIYVCGVTVYDLCHIGHARSAIVFDVLVRYLRAKGFDVTYIRNFTDVDDKIIDRANQLGKTTTDLAQENIDAFYRDMGALGVLNADQEPRATEHVGGMIQMILTLLEREYAYREGADVYFSVESFKGYGELSGRRLEDMQAGSRIAVDERKRHPMDFVLWKGAKPGEPQWESPWGPGRPGWHLECSVMSNTYLGPTFDIHGGGKDLLFPHHENERAQSVCANGGGFARYWVHNGFVTIESEKMSKSLGNFLTIQDAVKLHHPQVLRLFLLSKHYRSPIDFSKSAVDAMQAGLVRIYRTLQRLERATGQNVFAQAKNAEPASSGRLPETQDDDFMDRFMEAMDDDLNTAGAIGLLFDNIREINKVLDSCADQVDEACRLNLLEKQRSLILTGRILGLLDQSPDRFFESLVSSTDEGPDPAEVENLIEQRAQARKQKDWARADQIRDQLKKINVVLEDGPQGTTWRLDV